MYKKRLIDICLSVALLPFAIAIAIAICLVIAFVYVIVERENPFFARKRLGLGKNEFTLLKMRTMRTMRTNAAQVATHEVSKSSVTRLGAILRATKLDELPQIWNVLVGEMGFVGPGPGLPSQTALTEERQKLNVFSVRPGVTGPSQVKGIDMSDPEKLAISDSKCLQNIVFSGDLRLIVATAFGMGYGDKVV